MRYPNLTFSLDFDGIFTDKFYLNISSLNSEWFFSTERSVMYNPIRLGVRQLASFLQFFGKVIIATTRPPGHYKKIRYWLKKYSPELADISIITRKPSDYSRFFIDNNITMHLSHDFINRKLIKNKFPIVVNWINESPAQILDLILDKINIILENYNSPISASTLSLSSTTPTFLINKDGKKTKLKVFQSCEDQIKVKDFYKISENLDDEVFLPKIVSFSNLYIETEFIDGIIAEHATNDQKTSAIPALAKFLSRLHKKKPPKSNRQNFEVAYVSCALDQFNLCFTNCGTVAIIDVCDCLITNKWVDLIWTEQLYCSTLDEKEILFNSYITEKIPPKNELTYALKEYYSWLHYIIATGGNWHKQDRHRLCLSTSIAKLRSTLPLNSYIFQLCKK